MTWACTAKIWKRTLLSLRITSVVDVNGGGTAEQLMREGAMVRHGASAHETERIEWRQGMIASVQRERTVTRGEQRERGTSIRPGESRYAIAEERTDKQGGRKPFAYLYREIVARTNCTDLFTYSTAAKTIFYSFKKRAVPLTNNWIVLYIRVVLSTIKHQLIRI